MGHDRLVRPPWQRPGLSIPIHTFNASDFAGKSLYAYNTRPDGGASFIILGRTRIALGAGEEVLVTVAADADYRIGMGAGVRLDEGTGQGRLL